MINMFKNERQEEIISLLKAQRYATVEELTKMLFASPSSIRRDLTELENRGIVKRSYGGVELADDQSYVIPYSVRIDKNTAAKKIMAEKAEAFIEDGDVIFLDQSSSASYLAMNITGKKGITVVTNNIEIVMHLSQYQTNVICTGGKLCNGNRFALVGKDAENVFSQIHAKYAFFSAVGLDEQGNIYDYQYEEVAIRNAMFKNAEKTVFLCDSNKISAYSTYKQMSLSDVDILICENDDAEKYKKDFKHLVIL